jgi:hypothetical protein
MHRSIHNLRIAWMLALGLCGCAGAAIFTETETFSDTPNFAIPLEFDQWNPSWGTVNSITIELSLTAVGG